jgi:MFS family permease
VVPILIIELLSGMKTPTIAPTRPRINVQDTFSALRHPNYRLWFIGQLVSLVGTWMQNTAQGYLVYELTKSPAYLGYVGFVSGLPSWIFTLYGGVIADRISRRTLLIITQSSMMALAFILAGLVFTEAVQPWHIVLLAGLLGIANAFDAPARQAFVVELVDRQDMVNAIALNSTMFNAATVVGPSVAGITYALFGPAWCFTINGVSYIAVIVALALMHIQVPPLRRRTQSMLAELKEGLAYALHDRLTLVVTLSMGMVSLFGLSVVTLLPAWSVDVLKGDVTTNGLLLSARGAGALLGALMVASLGRMKMQGKLWTAGSFIMPVALLLFAGTRWLPLAMLILVMAGWGFMIQANTSNALVQSQVPDHLRGRVMGIYTLVFFGGMPLGALLAGGLADYLGEPLTLTLGAIALLVSSAVVWLVLPGLRRGEYGTQTN